MKTSKIFLIGVCLFMLCCILYLFKPFLLTISIGILIAVSTSGLHSKILTKCKNRQILAASVTTLILCVVFFVPFIYAIIALAKNAANFDIGYFNHILEYIKSSNFELPSFLKDFEVTIKNFISNLDFAELAKKILAYASAIAKSSANFVIQMGLIVVFYFFANLYGKNFVSFVKKTTPIEEKQIDYMFSETANTMSVVFYSTIFNAILQGFLFSIIAGIYGYNAVLFGVIFAFCSLIPAVGGALVYVPLGIFELANGNTSSAIVIVLYSFIVISVIADSFVKPFVIKFINSKLVEHPASINELLIFFAMLSGIATFGFWGVILGPAILTLFVSVLNLYANLK